MHKVGQRSRLLGRVCLSLRQPSFVPSRGFRIGADDHDRELKRSLGINSREDFWAEAAISGLDWYKPFDKVLDQSNSPFDRWFVNGSLNVCYNAVDRHVENGMKDAPAIAYDSPVTGQKYNLTFGELQDQVSRCAGVLDARGVKKGDRVVIYMPMIPEAAVAMLACARLGAIHSVVFGGFASKELAIRIDDAKPAAVISASCGVEPIKQVLYEPLLAGALEIAQHKPHTVLIKDRKLPPTENNATQVQHKLDWDEELPKANKKDCVPVLSTDPLYLLYTSGTTGAPKGVLRDSGGYATMLSYSMRNFMRVDKGECYWAASDIGWVVGHSYIVYGPLINGSKTVMYEGKPVGTPDAGAFWRVVQGHKVKSMFTAPTALRAIRRVDPTGSELSNYDLSSLQVLFLAGERADPDTVLFYHDKLGIPVIDNFWQTETGAPAAGYQKHEVGIRAGSVSCATPGYDIRVLCDKTSKELGANELGDVCFKLPLPPGAMQTIYNANERFKSSYLSTHEGYYLTGDAGFIDEDGYLSVMARTDDVINCAGHRLSSGALEEVIISHSDVAECAVVGAHHSEKGQVPVAFICLSSASDASPENAEKDVVAMVRRDIGPVAAFKVAITVPMLPKTRSGKILRGILKKMLDQEEYVVPGTIEDISVIDALETKIAEVYH